MRRFLLLVFSVLFVLHLHGTSGDSWSDILKNKSGTVVFYWFPNKVTHEDSKDIIDGVERELAFAFIDYLNTKYEIEIEVIWQETNSFDEVMQLIRNSGSGFFGASSISITSERASYLNFTPPYIADVSVLVSNAKLPIAQTPYEFRNIFNKLTAITIQNTTLKESLESLKKEQGLNFDVEYVGSSGNVIERIKQLDNGFGYIDLPNFLVELENDTEVRRQFFYPVKLQGLAMVYPLRSDWREPVNDYFSSNQFKLDKDRVITKYLGSDVKSVIEKIANSADFGPLEEIVISNREKEVQYKDLLEAAIIDKEKGRLNNLLLIATIAAFLVLLLLYISNRIKTRANQLLAEHQNEIELRNHQLQVLNEEKNDLIKVLAHDLRAPLSNISGLSMMLKKSKNFSKEDHKMADYIAQSSEKMESMITKILDVDALESGKRNMKIEAFDLSKIIDSVQMQNQSKADEKKIQLDFQTSLIMVSADRFYSEQILENLVSNAIKFSTNETVVRMRTSEVDDYIRISVEDQGPGFSKEDRKKIFKKYQRLSAQPTAGEDSVGLGLSIVRLYTEMMNGKISFETETGKGTTFFIDLKKAQQIST